MPDDDLHDGESPGGPPPRPGPEPFLPSTTPPTSPVPTHRAPPPPWGVGTPPPATAPPGPFGTAPPGPFGGLAGQPGWPNGAAVPAAPPRRRRRGRMVVALALAVALVLAGVGVAVFGASSPSSPPGTAGAARQLLRAALAAARRAGSFHYVATSTSTGPDGATQTTVGDAGPTSGRQVIRVGSQRFEVLVVGQALYFEGNAPALTANLALSSASATAHAGQWISLTRTDAPYATVYAAVTASSALRDNITLSARSELPAPTVVAGRNVRTVTGPITPLRVAGQSIAPKGTAALAVRAEAPHLPVRYTQRGTQSGQEQTADVSFSRWGETVTVTVPAHPVAYSSLGAGSGAEPSAPTGPVLT